MRKLRVAVLMGGTSTERAISLSTGKQIIAALDRQKYVPMALDAAALSGKNPPLPAAAAGVALPGTEPQSGVGADLVPVSFADIATPEGTGRPDVVFIALHGKGGEDGTVQGMLELLGIPYTGSGVLASALAMDKSMAKRVLKAEGIPVPGEVLVHRAHRLAAGQVHQRVSAAFGYPVIVKPNAQGSTIGCTIVQSGDALEKALDEAFKYDASVLVEQFVTGTEITIGLLGNEEPEALPVVEIVAKGGFYDYEAKYAAGGSEHIIPARISELATARAKEYAIRAHKTLGCRGMSRVDLIVVGDQPFVLEVNTIPGMTPTSLLPDSARAAGIGFSALLDRILHHALESYEEYHQIDEV